MASLECRVERLEVEQLAIESSRMSDAELAVRIHWVISGGIERAGPKLWAWLTAAGFVKDAP
jgi:hypothetical protein